MFHLLSFSDISIRSIGLLRAGPLCDLDKSPCNCDQMVPLGVNLVSVVGFCVDNNSYQVFNCIWKESLKQTVHDFPPSFFIKNANYSFLFFRYVRVPFVSFLTFVGFSA